MSQQAIDGSNAAFWDTLCGSTLARQAGITGESPNDLCRFDELYLGRYPYLERYLPASLQGENVLEIGLGYGTLGQLLAERGADYHGVDIAAEPVAMMRRRMAAIGRPAEQIVQASVLELPFDDRTFNRVYSIGCLHHTGDLEQSVSEVHRVLVPGGTAVVMLYNRHSLRLVAFELLWRLQGARGPEVAGRKRALYDADQSGEAAPHTEFVSRRDVRRLFGEFARVRVESQNFDGFRFGLRREWFLSNLARVVGLDLYVVGDKRR
jgi:ubiquinone/menaquinone biosynthesis C-methylase UbiE